MTKTKQNMAQAEKLVKDILSKDFNQKVSAKSLKAAATKVLDSVPTARKTTKAA